MGFDNECIFNIQSLPGEYFCPVCRTLVYPNEALQTQCTHLYCKQCFDYTVAYTGACPYDNYPVTAAESKPLIESNKTLAETIGKVLVYCFYYRSGCQWQGTFSECLTHSTSCNFGDSPVVCNRCGTQILHREVQDHAQKCPALQPQGQQNIESSQAQSKTSSGQLVAHDQFGAASTASQAASTQAASATAASATNTDTSVATAPTVAAVAAASAPASSSAILPAASAQGQPQVNVTSYMQTTAQVPAPQQWYQQQLQYQQYFQQYPGYDPYQQQYQQYAQYQQAYAQYAQPQMLVAQQHLIQGQQQQHAQSQPQAQPQSQVQSQAQALVQPQTQVQPQPQAQPQPQVQTQSQPQVQTHPQLQPQIQPHPHPQAQPQLQPLPQQQQLVQPQLAVVQSQAQTMHPRPMQQQGPQTQLQGPQLQPHPNTVAQTHPPRPNAPPQQHYPQAHPQTHPLAGQPGQLHPQAQGHNQLVSSHQPSLQPHMQQQSHPQQQPHMHAQPQVHSNAVPPMQVQQPHVLPQPHAQTYQQPQPKLVVQAQPQQPSAAVTGHQSYPQPPLLPQTQPGAPTQRPVLVHSQQHGMPYQPPTQAVQMQNQFAPQQPLQLRPNHGNTHIQMQQQPVALPQGSHVNLPHQQPNYLQSHGHGQHLQQYPGMQSQVPQQTLPHMQSHGHMHPEQQHHQVLPSQQQIHQHGQPTMQQHVAPGLTNLAQPVAARPSMVNHGMPKQLLHQSIDGPPMQPGYNQQGPVPNPRSAGQLSQLPESAPQGPESEAMSASKGTLKTEAIDFNQSQAKVYAPADMKIQKLNLRKDGDEVTEEAKEMGSDVDTAQVIGEGHMGAATEDRNLEVDGSNQSIKVISDLSDNKHAASYSLKVESGDVGILNATGEPTNKSTEQPEDHSRGHGAVEKHSSRQLSYSGDKVLQQPTQQGTGAHSSGRAPLLSGFHDKSLSQVTSQGPGPDMSHGLPPVGLASGQAVPHGHASNLYGSKQTFPPPERQFQQIPQTGQFQEKRLQEPLPYQMQDRGQNMPPSQMRPPFHNASGPFSNQSPFVPEPLQSHSVHAGIPGAAFPSAVPTGNLGPPPKNIGEQGLPSQGHGLSNMPLQYSGSASVYHGEPRMRPPVDGPPFGVADRPSGMMARGPHFGMEDRTGASHPSNALEMESFDTRRPFFADGKQSDPKAVHSSINNANANGGPDERFRHFPEDGKRPAQDGMLRPFPIDSGRHAVTRREFEEDLKQFPRPTHLEGEGQRRFEDYSSSSRPLSRGPGQLGPDSVPRHFDNVLPGPFGPGSSTSDHRLMDSIKGHRNMPSVKEFGGKAEFGRNRMDGLPPLRSPGREYGKSAPGSKSHREDLNGGEPHTINERSKFSNLQSDLVGDSKHFRPPIMGAGPLPGHFLGGHTPEGFGSMRKEFDARNPHTPFGHGDPMGHGFSGNIHGQEMFGSRIMPRPFPGGDPLVQNHPGHGGNFSFSDFPREAGHYGSFPMHGELDAFERSRNRKPGSNCWCLICKVDCETLEGLDMHSQTRDHQKVAMDMVLSIKQENAKKKRTAEVAMPLEMKKRRKMGYDGHGKRTVK